MGVTTYEDVLAANIRAARARARLEQAQVVDRMRSLGFATWHRQTLGKIERGDRRLLAGELVALAWALQTNLFALLKPAEEDQVVEFPSGGAIGVASIGRSIGGLGDEAVTWPEGDDKPVFTVLDQFMRPVTPPG